jgi:hypothetical protein
MTTCAASQSTPALEPVRNYAFMYEASDIRPGITIDDSARSDPGTATDVGSTPGSGGSSRECKGGHSRDVRPRALLVASPARTMKGTCDDDDRASGRPGKDRGHAAPRGRDPAAPWAEESTPPAVPATSRAGDGRLQAASLNRRPLWRHPRPWALAIITWGPGWRRPRPLSASASSAEVIPLENGQVRDKTTPQDGQAANAVLT